MTESSYLPYNIQNSANNFNISNKVATDYLTTTKKVVIAISLVFLALAIIAGAVLIALSVSGSFSFPLIIVFGVFTSFAVIGLAVSLIDKVIRIFRKSRFSVNDTSHSYMLKNSKLQLNDLHNYYSQIVTLKSEDKTITFPQMARNFFYDKNDFEQSKYFPFNSAENFLFSLYSESYHLLSCIYPQKTDKDLNLETIQFLSRLEKSNSLEFQLENLLTIFNDNTLRLEIASLLARDSSFSCGALAYVLEKILSRGISVSKQEDFLKLFTALSNEMIALWTLSQWDREAKPYSLKILLFVAKYSGNIELLLPLPSINKTLWECILHSHNKEAIIIFLFEYGVLNCNEDGDSALHVAIQEGYVDLIPFLLEKGCDLVVEATNKYDQNIFSSIKKLLIKRPQQQVISVILTIIKSAYVARGLSPTFQADILISLLQLNFDLSIFRSLIGMVNPWSVNSSGETLYHYALLENKLDIVEWCLKDRNPYNFSLIKQTVNNQNLLISFLSNFSLNESLFKLMLFRGLSLNISVTKHGGNLLSYLADLGRLDILLPLFQLFKVQEEGDLFYINEQERIEKEITSLVNSVDNKGNNLLHHLGSSEFLDLKTNECEEFLVLLMEYYKFTGLSTLNKEYRSPIVNAIINRKWILASLLLNFVNSSDIINAGAKNQHIIEHSHPFFLWMMYYNNIEGSGEVIEKFIRKGLDLNLILLPSNKTIKDMCVEWNLEYIIHFLKRIGVWENMLFSKEL